MRFSLPLVSVFLPCFLLPEYKKFLDKPRSKVLFVKIFVVYQNRDISIRKTLGVISLLL